MRAPGPGCSIRMRGSGPKPGSPPISWHQGYDASSDADVAVVGHVPTPVRPARRAPPEVTIRIALDPGTTHGRAVSRVHRGEAGVRASVQIEMRDPAQSVGTSRMNWSTSSSRSTEPIASGWPASTSTAW